MSRSAASFLILALLLAGISIARIENILFTPGVDVALRSYMIAVTGTATLGIVCGAYRMLRTGQLDQPGVWLFLSLFSLSVADLNGVLNWHAFSINFHIMLFDYGFGPNFVGLLLAWWYRVVCQKTGREIAQGSVQSA